MLPESNTGPYRVKCFIYLMGFLVHVYVILSKFISYLLFSFVGWYSLCSYPLGRPENKYKWLDLFIKYSNNLFFFVDLFDLRIARTCLNGMHEVLIIRNPNTRFLSLKNFQIYEILHYHIWCSRLLCWWTKKFNWHICFIIFVVLFYQYLTL
jgi:hypothetical protein